MTNNNFTREYRLCTPKDYDQVFKDPFRVSNASVTILSIKNDLNKSRIGIIVPKKNIKKATIRNRIKRIIRESYRCNRINIPNIDMVVIVKKDANNLENRQLFVILEKLWKKISHYSKKSA